MERCLVLRQIAPLMAMEQAHARESAISALPLRQARDAFERSYLEDILRRHEDNVSAAARAAGVDRIHFYRLLHRHGLR